MTSRLLALALLLVALVTAPLRAWAQEGHGARDLLDRLPEGGITVPPLPADHAVERRGSLTISYPRALREVVAPALGRAERDARAVAAQFGMREVPPLTVRLVADPEMMRRLAPPEVPPPSYAVGVAYAPVRLALVSASAPRTWEASNMAQVLRHELSHLLLAEATRHAALPRWLAEGIAVQQSDENSFERFQELASASWTGRLLPLARLDEGFSENPSEVNAAYAEAADFVGYLLRKDGAARFAVLVGHVREGLPLAEAVEETYGASFPRVEEEWRADLSDRVAFAPIWAGTGVLSVAGALLVVVALVRRWRKNRATLARWDREERVARWRILGRPMLRLVRPDEAPRDGERTLH